MDRGGPPPGSPGPGPAPSRPRRRAPGSGRPGCPRPAPRPARAAPRTPTAGAGSRSSPGHAAASSRSPTVALRACWRCARPARPPSTARRCPPPRSASRGAAGGSPGPRASTGTWTPVMRPSSRLKASPSPPRGGPSASTHARAELRPPGRSGGGAPAAARRTRAVTFSSRSPGTSHSKRAAPSRRGAPPAPAR